MEKAIILQRKEGVGTKKSLAKILKKYWPLYVMLAPCLLYYAVFKYGPMYGIVIAFKNYKISDGILGSPWVHPILKHFQYFFSSPYASQIIKNTLIISALKILFGLIPPVVLAVIISECRCKWYGKLAQTASYLPHFLSWVIIYGISVAFFSQSTGLINRWITELGGASYPFLTSSEHFRAILVGTDVWKGMGWGAIIYLAAITGIDPSLYEAASLDGCSRFKRILFITLPCLRNVFLMQLILRMGSVLDAGFDQIYIMSTQQVLDVSEILDTWVFKEGLQRMNYSLASAVGLLKSTIGLVLVFGTNKLARKWGSALW